MQNGGKGLFGGAMLIHVDDSQSATNARDLRTLSRCIAYALSGAFINAELASQRSPVNRHSMEKIDVTFNGNAFHIEGFPDAVKILKITGPKGKRLADLALHKSDLAFSLECLKAINCTPVVPPILRDVLWETAIVRFIKCFGQNEARFSLDPKAVYTAGGGLEAYKYFLSLRNKHIIHD